MASGKITRIRGFETVNLNSPDDLDDLYNTSDAGVYYVISANHSPVQYAGLIVICTYTGAAFQLLWRRDGMYYRARTGSPLAWNSWRQVTDTIVN